MCRIVLADVAMICTGLFGALSINNYRWGYYTISCLFFLIVLWGPGRPSRQGGLRAWQPAPAPVVHVLPQTAVKPVALSSFRRPCWPWNQGKL